MMRESTVVPESAKALQTKRPDAAGTSAERADALASLSQAGGNQFFLSLLGRTAIQSKSRIGRAGDRFEQEADRVAAAVVHAAYGDAGAVATTLSALPGGAAIQRKCGKCGGGSGGHKCAACEREEETIRRWSRDDEGVEVAGPEAPSPHDGFESEPATPVSPAEPAESPADEQQALPSGEVGPGNASPTEPVAANPSLLVEDGAEDVGPQQMKKTEFLDLLRAGVCRTVDEALAGTGRDSKGCPYVEYWFAYLAGKDASFIERGIRRYAPEAAGVDSAADYISAISNRVRRSADRWARTGEIVGVPEELAGVAGSGTPDAGASTTRIQFKARAGGAVQPDDPSTVRSDLGAGLGLDAGVRSRMESAFGVGFGQVRVHTDPVGARLSDRLNARAFTVGNHIAFGPGEYRPGTLVGDALIAHELAHVVQQTGASESAVDGASSSLEVDADHSAFRVMTRLVRGTAGSVSNLIGQAIPRLRSGLTLQRCAKKYNCEVASGPTYTPSGTIPVVTSGGRKRATFDFAAEFKDDPARDVRPSACEVRQYIKWDATYGKRPHSGFPSGATADTWYEDRDKNDNRYGRRSGSHSDPISGCGDEYLTGTTQDQANGNKYCGKDSPSIPAADTGAWNFQLKVLDVDHGDAEKASSSEITVNW